jgi:hypothetical protein
MLKAGDVVEVRTPGEILSTLDGDASADAMPFMPEMLEHAGRRFTVSARAEKVCDTVSGGFPRSLRLRDTVLLDDLRCDGSAHGGCQAGCRLYWKESWLRRIEPGDEEGERDPQDGAAALAEVATAATRAVRDVGGAPKERYRCQATEALQASEPLPRYGVRQHLRELRVGNVGLGRFLRVAARGLTGPIRRRLRLLRWQPLPPSEVTVPTTVDLQLKPGDLVEVRSTEEISRTVDEQGKTRGLAFDWEMVPYCGGRYRVQDRVERIINEGTGEMIEIKSDCVILDGVVCRGDHSNCRWFCPRAIYPFWREAWLRRVENGDGHRADEPS